jgi:two-component system, OmpR family, response regulator
MERGRLRLDFDTYEAFLAGKPLGLSPRAFELLKFFVRHPNRVYDRLQLLHLVWGPRMQVDVRTVDALVHTLRNRLERDDDHPEVILTVRGRGYKFNPTPLSL